jgi:hypothetical protein
MTDFNREFPIDCRGEAVLRESGWFSDLLRCWRPAGEAVGAGCRNGEVSLLPECKAENDLKHLRVAFRDGYMNFYRGGQSIAKVSFLSQKKLQARLHNKYVYGRKEGGQAYVTLTSAEFPEREIGRLVPYSGLDSWISNANEYVGHEKRFVDLIVAHNPNVIDLEMGLPAYSKAAGKNRAPRMDLVALEAKGGWWQIVFWEAKLVDDGRARCRGSDAPRVVVGQLADYTDWLDDEERKKRVVLAYQETCRMLVRLHAVARYVCPDIQELGSGIREVAAPGAPPLGIDCKPRLVIDNCRKDVSFEAHKHLEKLRSAPCNLQVKMVEKLKDLVL